jgi:hypothetical protein
MDDSRYRLFFYLDKKDEIYHYSSKEHPKISKIAKFGCEVGSKVAHFSGVILKCSKFANFTGLYFPYFTTFRNQTLQFY